MPTIETTYEKPPFTATVKGELTVITKTRGHNLEIDEIIIDEIEITELWVDIDGTDYQIHKGCVDQVEFDDEELRVQLIVDNSGEIDSEFQDKCAEYGEYLYNQIGDY